MTDEQKQVVEGELLLPDEMRVKTISVTYGRKFNLDNYESMEVAITVWADRPENTDIEADLEELWKIAKAQVRAQALPALKKRDEERAEAAALAATSRRPMPPAPARIPAPPATSATPTPTPASTGAQGDTKAGTAELTAIKVDADGRVEFHCKGFRWPFKDSRGAETVVGLFDQALGWTAEHLRPGANYPLEGQGYKVDWEKPDKYYNVLLVHIP